jgi:hypothetical protein
MRLLLFLACIMALKPRAEGFLPGSRAAPRAPAPAPGTTGTPPASSSLATSSPQAPGVESSVSHEAPRIASLTGTVLTSPDPSPLTQRAPAWAPGLLVIKRCLSLVAFMPTLLMGTLPGLYPNTQAPPLERRSCFETYNRSCCGCPSATKRMVSEPLSLPPSVRPDGAALAEDASPSRGSAFNSMCMGFGCGAYQGAEFGGLSEEPAEPSISYPDFLKAVDSEKVLKVSARLGRRRRCPGRGRSGVLGVCPSYLLEGSIAQGLRRSKRGYQFSCHADQTRPWGGRVQRGRISLDARRWSCTARTGTWHMRCSRARARARAASRGASGSAWASRSRTRRPGARPCGG